MIRFFDGDGEDIIPRKDRVWDKRSLSQRMIRALNVAQQTVPHALYVLAGVKNPDEQTSLSALQQAAIAQHCFWTEERVIGAIDGVEETEAGFLKGREVTLFRYDPQIVSLEEVYRVAMSHGVGDEVYTDLSGYKKAPLRDQKRQIKGTAFSQIEMTNAQSTKVIF